MIPEELYQNLKSRVDAVTHPRELAIDVLYALQNQAGWLTEEAVEKAAALLGMTPLEVEELATFYPFLYREKVGKYVIHVCDSVVCWMNGGESLKDYLCEKLGTGLGGTSPDGLFTLLPVCCIGYCDLSPAMLVNRKAYGPLTKEKIDQIIKTLKNMD